MKKNLLLLLALCFSLFASAQDGTLDLTFNPGTGAENSYIYSTVIQSDGKILIGGGFTSYNSTARNSIARLNNNGSLDASFNPGAGANNVVRSIAIQLDGKIIIGGAFTIYNGIVKNKIARLNIDGSLDTTFNPGAGPNDNVYSINIQLDGKIVIGGYFTNYAGVSREGVARLNSDGSLDTTFNPGTGANDLVYSTIIQSDGKIIIGGYFTAYNGTVRFRVARLNSDGSLDTTFNPGAGANNDVYSVALQLDGRIIIGGGFTTYNGVARNRIALLNNDGSLDTTFDSSIGASNYVYSAAIQSDGKIIIGGYFTAYNGTDRFRLARLNSDGSLDTTFNPGAGASGGVHSIVIQSDEQIIIGGIFLFYNGTGRNRIARINATSLLDVNENELEINELIVYNNNNDLHIKYPRNKMQAVTIYNATGKQIYESKNLNNSELVINNLKATKQFLIVRVQDENNVMVSKKIIF
jgi:uncharacterized delta-60 repeat protein